MVGSVLPVSVCGWCGLHVEFGDILSTELGTCVASAWSFDLAIHTLTGFWRIVCLHLNIGTFSALFVLLACLMFETQKMRMILTLLVLVEVYRAKTWALRVLVMLLCMRSRMRFCIYLGVFGILISHKTSSFFLIMK